MSNGLWWEILEDVEITVYRRVLHRLAAISVLDSDDKRLKSMLYAIQDWDRLHRHGEHTEEEQYERCRVGIRRLEQELANDEREG